jgi:ATP-binding cassette subfamily B multidrug efflux pump
MSFLKKYVNKYWKPFTLSVTFLMFEALCDLAQPTIMSKIIDIGVKKKDLNFVLYMGGIMLLVTSIGAVAATGRNIVSSNVSQKFGAELRLDLFKKVHYFSFDNINKFEAASLMTRLTNDVTQVQNFVHGLMRIFVKAPITCIGSIIMAILINPPMAIILIAVVPLVGLLISMNMKIGYPFFSKVQKALDKVNGVMREYLSGVRVVKAFNRFGYEVERFEKNNKEFTNLSIRTARVMAIFSPSITLVVNIGIVMVLWIGGIRVENGSMKVGQIIAFINYMTQILFSLIMITNVFNMLVRAKASAERIGEVFDEENTMINNPSSAYEGEVKGRVDFENVAFSYAGAEGEPVLKDISFTCMPGETLGIIGSTGSGKTSLVNLIPRFYDVTCGCVKVDGIDVKELDMRELREKIAIVTQKTTLFTGSIIENIRWGKEDATKDEVEVAARVSQAHEFVDRFPEQYSTILGQGGVNLSGGQKQRVAIARALIKKPEILILDDSTSAVDVTTEVKIRSALKEYSKNLTCIIIAQRISSVIDADRIVVLNDGEVDAIGTHEELINSSEVYKDIFRSQIGKGVI